MELRLGGDNRNHGKSPARSIAATRESNRWEWVEAGENQDTGIVSTQLS